MGGDRVRDWIADRGLTLVLMTMFLASLTGQVLTGQAEYNSEQQRHGDEPVPVYDVGPILVRVSAELAK